MGRIVVSASVTPEEEQFVKATLGFSGWTDFIKAMIREQRARLPELFEQKERELEELLTQVRAKKDQAITDQSTLFSHVFLDTAEADELYNLFKSWRDKGQSVRDCLDAFNNKSWRANFQMIGTSPMEFVKWADRVYLERPKDIIEVKP